MKRRYRRYFVMLEQEDKGFAHSKAEAPKGYGKIEVRNEKGTLSLYCQNLKQLEEKKERYRIYLISTKNQEEPTVVDIGPIKVEDNGKGEAIWEFNTENVKGFERAIEEFDTIALMVEPLEGSQRITAPLVGYIHKEKVNWRSAIQKKQNAFMPYTSQDQADKKLEPEVEEKSEEKPSPNVEEQTEDSKEPKLEAKTKQSIEAPSKVEAVLEPVVEPVAEPEKEADLQSKSEKEETLKVEEKLEEEAKEEVKEEIKEEIEESVEEEGKEEVKVDLNLQSSYSFEKDWDAKKEEELTLNSEAQHLQKYIESTLKVYPKVEPFEEKMQDYEWWQIHYNTQTIYRAYMPFIAYVEMLQNPHYYYNPYYYNSEYHKQLYMYQHHLFGVCYDDKKRVKYYVYGIPGRRTTIEQPYRGKTGFGYWRPSHEKPFNQEGFGYWLMHVDANSGEVTQPLKPTKL